MNPYRRPRAESLPLPWPRARLPLRGQPRQDGEPSSTEQQPSDSKTNGPGSDEDGEDPAFGPSLAQTLEPAGIMADLLEDDGTEMMVSDGEKSIYDSDAANMAQAFGRMTEAELGLGPEETASPEDGSCRFDDEEVDMLSSDTDLDWERAPFDYDVIFEATESRMLPSEPGLPNYPFAGSRAARMTRRIASDIVSQVRAMHGQLIQVYDGEGTAAEKAAQVAQLVTVEAQRHGRMMTREALRLGKLAAEAVARGLPDLMLPAGGEGWVDLVTGAVVEVAAWLPPLEQRAMQARVNRR